MDEFAVGFASGSQDSLPRTACGPAQRRHQGKGTSAKAMDDDGGAGVAVHGVRCAGQHLFHGITSMQEDDGAGINGVRRLSQCQLRRALAAQRHSDAPGDQSACRARRRVHG